MRTRIRPYAALVLKNIDLFMFVFLTGWSITEAIRLNRFYQDSWILEGLWGYLFLLVGMYIIIITRRTDLQIITITTFILSCLLYVLPALKYTYAYSSTTDVATHLSFSESITETGRLVATNVYSSTPGFHVLSGVLSQSTGLQIGTIEKILPGLLGSFIPLCLYVLCKRSGMPGDLSKWIIALSSLSLPVLYTLNGTGFTSPIFICLVTFIVLRFISTNENGVQYTLIAFLFILQILFWHPSTSFIYPIFFILVGILGAIFRKSIFITARFRGFLSIGILAGISTFYYWMYNARYVWSHFLENLEVILEREVSPNLIPVRLFQISLADRTIIALLYHARDGIFISLALLGLLFLFFEKENLPFIRIITSIASVFVISLALLSGVFLINFGTQGYQRFLIYSVVTSPVMAGFGLWKAGQFINRRLHFNFKKKLASALILTLIFFISFVQLYPYQNLIPTYTPSSYNPKLTPVLWMHQVNTGYQYYMLGFALSHFTADDQILSDYVGTHQDRIFFGIGAQGIFRSWLDPKPEAGLILLHWPGPAGPYQDTLELRSMDRINALRTHVHMSTIYDNGYSFILYYPNNVRSVLVSETKQMQDPKWKP